MHQQVFPSILYLFIKKMKRMGKAICILFVLEKNNLMLFSGYFDSIC